MEKLNSKFLKKIVGGMEDEENVLTKKKWKYITHGSSVFNFLVCGVKIFEHFKEWKATGESAEVMDPLYNVTKIWPVYTLDINGVATRFSVDEFSNGIWGLYLEEDE